MNVFVSRPALTEVQEAAEYHDRERPGLGDDLYDAFERALRRLGERPDIGPEVGFGERKLVLQRFRYSVIYRVEDEGVFVLAFAHHRRRPGYWRDDDRE